MGLLAPDGEYSAEQLAGLLAEFRESLESMRSLISSPPGAVRDPSSLRTAADLVSALLDVISLAEAPEAPARLKVRAVNASYEALVAAIDLVKSHTEVPTVPRPRRP